MSDIEGELARVREAFDKPTLRLLDRKWAPLVLAVFKTSFGRDNHSIKADRLHTQVDAYLGQLRSSGVSVPPDRTGRTLCVQWMNDQWLYRATDDADEEVYSLTSHALEALSMVESLSKERALISESRLTTIMETVRLWATEADPDREGRIMRLDAQIDQLTAERDRLAAGGDILTASNERMLDGYANLSNLIEQLPSDFRRVEESVSAMHRQIVDDFRHEDRPIGEIIDEYLARTDELMTSTAEGRAFDGAVALLRDDDLLLALKRDLQTILDHPFAASLAPSEQRDFRGTVSVIRQGIDAVLAQRSRLTTTLREHIVNHDVVKDRELDALLREINKELATWMRSAGPRATVPIELLAGTVEMEHLRQRFYDPASEVPPPPLDDVSLDAPDGIDMDDLRRQGGPMLSELRDAIVSAHASGPDEWTLADAFNAFDPALRRPVEVFGLLHLATQAESLPTGPGIGTEIYRTVRPDGSDRLVEVPRMILDQDDVAAWATLDDHGDEDD